MAGKDQLVGTLGVGVTARTKKYHNKMRKAAKAPREFRKAVQKESQAAGSTWAAMSEKVRKGAGTVTFGMQQATQGLLQFTDQAGAAGRAAGAMGGVLQGAFSAGLSGAAFAGITGIFAIITEEKRKAEEAMAREAEKRAQREKDLADRALQDAQQLNDRMVQLRNDRAEREAMAALDAREAEAKQTGQFFDRVMELELRAAKRGAREKRTLLSDELGALDELRKAYADAGAANKKALADAIKLREQNVRLLREEVAAEKARPDQAKAAAAARAQAKAAAEMKAHNDKLAEAAAAAQKARTDEMVALRQSVDHAERLASMTDEERKHATAIEQIRRAEALGMTQLAARMRKLLEYERDRAKHAKDAAEHKAREARATSINKHLRQREKLAKATSEAERFAVQQQAEYVRLLSEGADRATVLNTLAAERAKFLKSQKTAANETVEALRRQLELAKAGTKEAREQIARQHELNDVRKSGGAEAVRLQEQLNALKDKQAAKDRQEAARAKRMNDRGVGGARFDRDGNFQGLGLAAARQARRDALRSRKRRRAEAGRMGRSIHDGRFSGLGGIRSGRRLDQAGAFSGFSGGAGDMGAGPNRPGFDPTGGNKDGAGLQPGDPQAGPGGPTPPGHRPGPTTNHGGPAVDGRNQDAINKLAEAEEKQRKAFEDAMEGIQKAAEAASESAAAAEAGTESVDALAEAATKQAEAAERQQDALENLGAGVADALSALVDKTNENTREMRDLKADLAQIQQALAGG